jgi:TonB family protein
MSRSCGRSCLPTYIANPLPPRIICFLILMVVWDIPIHALPPASQGNTDNASAQEKISDQKKSETAPKAGSIEILSDTQGVDFGRYMKKLRYTVQMHWDPLVPAVALPPTSKSGTVVIEFAIMKDGKVDGMKLTKSSNDFTLDAAAWGAIINSIPLPTLPQSLKLILCACVAALPITLL